MNTKLPNVTACFSVLLLCALLFSGSSDFDNERKHKLLKGGQIVDIQLNTSPEGEIFTLSEEEREAVLSQLREIEVCGKGYYYDAKLYYGSPVVLYMTDVCGVRTMIAILSVGPSPHYMLVENDLFYESDGDEHVKALETICREIAKRYAASYAYEKNGHDFS